MEHPENDRSERRDEGGQHLDEGTVHAWLDGQLSVDDAARVEAHAAGCEACAALVVEARGFVAASSRILTALDDVPARVLPQQRRRLRPWQIRAAAAVVILALGTTVVLHDAGAPRFASREVDALADKRAASPSAALPRVAAPAPTPAPSAPASPQSMLAPRVPSSPPAGRMDERSAPRAGIVGGVAHDSVARARSAKESDQVADQSAARARAQEAAAAATSMNAMAKAPAGTPVPARTGAVAGAAGGFRRLAAPTVATDEPPAKARIEPKTAAPPSAPAAAPTRLADSLAARAQATSAVNASDSAASLQRQITGRLATAPAACLGKVVRVAASLPSAPTADSIVVRLDSTMSRHDGYPGFALAAPLDSARAPRGDWIPTGSDSAQVEVDAKGEPVRTRVGCRP